MKQFIILFLILPLLIACDNAVINNEPPDQKDSTSSKKLKGDLFKEDSLSADAQRDKIFRPILSKSLRSETDKLLEKLSESYRMQLEDGLVLNRLYTSKIYGCSDSVWVMECSVPKDSLCKPHGRKQQFFFDAKGHLIHSDKAAVLKWVFFKDKSAPLLMTLNTDCKGTGYHHFYKFDQGELLDIFNVLLENTPPTFDAIASDGSDFQPQELELKMEDKNDDKIKDICFKGMKQLYKNGNFIKAQPVEYVFIFQPGEDWFLLKSLNK
jgi:hypothetical protein